MSENPSGGTIVGQTGETGFTALKDAFLTFVGRNYDLFRRKYMGFCKANSLKYDDDVLSETILSCADIILRKGLKRATERGMECYLFKSFSTNIRRESTYARNRYVDDRFSGNVDTPYEDYACRTMDAPIEKVRKDFFDDFAVLYLLSRASDALPAEDVDLYRMKTLTPGMTYRRLSESTGVRRATEKVGAVRQWLRDNVTKEEVLRAFYSEYGDIFPD